MNAQAHLDYIVAIARMRSTAIDTGWTCWLVHRNGTTEPKDLLCTIAKLPTDHAVARSTGRLGDYPGSTASIIDGMSVAS